MKERFSVMVIGILLMVVSTSVVAKVQLGPRPFYLVNAMNEGELKEELLSCTSGPFKPSNFSIAHRGAPLQFPEHTKESYIAAARMGAGIIECDVTFTSDRELVCRHSQCDLHTTTNILSVPELAAKCTKGFDPAVIDKSTGELIKPASARCCTSDITLEEFLSLEGKMDASNSRALSVEEFLAGTASFRTDLYSGKGTLMTHAESIVLFESLGVGMTPELKAAAVNMPYKGYTQKEYAQQLIDEYIAAGISPNRVWPQSFNLDDVRYWIDNTPEFGRQAIYLDGRYRSNEFDPLEKSSWKPTMSELRGYGVSTIAPPIWVLLQLNDGAIVPSTYARAASDAGLDIISWTLERSGLLASGGGWYYQSVKDVINNDGDVYSVLDVLAQDVGVVGVFSDWPATVTYYANCMDF
ncbi:MAG: glycerophosphodiester phosphodiesterase [Gammaproteobacteria bacterium]|nr:glycerophosphodiester phosphodiesterase [Gammaproteobacteria bacterium]